MAWMPPPTASQCATMRSVEAINKATQIPNFATLPRETGAERDAVAGVTLVLYAALVAASFAILLAEGRLSEWNVVLKMPGAFAIGF